MSLKSLPLLAGVAVFASLGLTACLPTSQSASPSATSGNAPAANPGVIATGTPPGGNVSGSSILDRELQAEIQNHGLTGDASIGRTLPNISDPLPQLGMDLFFTKGLGGDMDSACATCHHPALVGGDGLSVGVGVHAVDPDLLGPGRTHKSGTPNHDGGPTIPRNSPTTFNVALYDKSMFWNGRVESLGATPGANGDDGLGITTPDVPYPTIDPLCPSNLTQAQARFPITSMDEMRGFVFEFGNFPQPVREHLAARLGDYGVGAGELPFSDWLDRFRIAFNDPTGTAQDLITEQNMATALAEYERSQIFVDNPWRDYVQGNPSAISDDAKRGALLFLRDRNSGGADCASCHSGDFFTDEEHYVLAMPQVGRGQSVNIGYTQDFGRFLVDGMQQNNHAFRTPALLNVAVTGPWSHSGAYTTLEGVVKHHLDPWVALSNYDFNQLAPDVQVVDTLTNTTAAYAQLLWNRNNGFTTIENLSLTQQELDQILAFLDTLTDPNTTNRAYLDAWIPFSPDPDGQRLVAHDQQGNPL
jgi:cytochrome c peroxidase